MIYRQSTHSILRKKLGKGLRVYILAVLAAFSLSGCAGQRREIEKPEMEEPEMVMEPTQTEEPGEAEVAEVDKIEGTEAIKEIEEAEEKPLTGSDNLNMPEIEVSQDSFSMKVKIQNAEEYQAFVGCLEKYTESVSLTLNLEETNTVIYLDDILAYQNFKFLTINSGGIISARNMETLNDCPVRSIELVYPYAIEENVLSQMSGLEDVMIDIDAWYNGTLPAKELLRNTTCNNIIMRWDDEWKEEVDLEGFDEWDEINVMLPEDGYYIKALYVLNGGDYHYISYEFSVCGEESGRTCETNACAAFICIKDRESYGEKYFDILEVPVESIDTLSWLDGRRVRLMDVNFDGYYDLIFTGYNPLSPFGTGGRYIGFLWDEKEQRYKWNATVPKYINRIDDKRKRIIYINPNCTDKDDSSIRYDDYRIYEYHDGVFTEKRLKVMFPNSGIIWQYYEEGELLKRLESNYDEEAKLYYITYEENGIVTEKVMEEADYDNKYGYFHELGKEYFPEFDFYWAG